MEVGKLYKSIMNGVVVKCTKLSNDKNYFTGYVVKPCFDNIMKIGYMSENWYSNSFIKYNEPANSTQIGGDHYNKKAIQPIDYILANDLNFCEGNVVKYITRYKDKNGVEDLKKAKQYIDFLIKDYESKESI